MLSVLKSMLSLKLAECLSGLLSWVKTAQILARSAPSQAKRKAINSQVLGVGGNGMAANGY